MINRTKTKTLVRKPSLVDIIGYAGLQENLQVCLDVVDYEGGNIWRDSSGNGNDYRPVQVNTNGTPVFNGTIGRGSELDYFGASLLNNGGFIPNNTPTWDDNIHKNNGLFSFIAVVFLRLPNIGADFILANNGDSSGVALNNGINVAYARNTNAFRFRYDTDNTASSGTVQTSEDPTDTNVLKYLALSFNENGNILMKNGLRRPIATTAATASSNTTNPSFPVAIGCLGDQTQGMDVANDPRLYCIAMWTRALTSTDLETLGELIKQHRFPDIK